jgi:hypothetical protein
LLESLLKCSLKIFNRFEKPLDDLIHLNYLQPNQRKTHALRHCNT